MSDPLDALRQPFEPADPDPAFAAGLRARLERVLLAPAGPDPTGAAMPNTDLDEPATAARLGTVTPYLIVDDGRRALDWYVDVFAARRRGEPIIMPDGRVGHAELALGDSVLMLADEFPELELLAPRARGGSTVSLRVEVPDVDATVERAVAAGAALTRPVADEGYGRSGTVVDPFGHRWMVSALSAGQRPAAPAEPPTPAHGDIGYVTLTVPDADRARAFYGAVLGWRFSPGRVEQGWQVEGPAPGAGLWGGQEPGAQLCFRVDDLDAAVERVRAEGGEAGEPAAQGYGRLAECVDNQGLRFQLWGD
jgi:uncharacterized glyoxalase superfamily protein PhnB